VPFEEVPAAKNVLLLYSLCQLTATNKLNSVLHVKNYILHQTFE